MGEERCKDISLTGATEEPAVISKIWVLTIMHEADGEAEVREEEAM